MHVQNNHLHVFLQPKPISASFLAFFVHF